MNKRLEQNNIVSENSQKEIETKLSEIQNEIDRKLGNAVTNALVDQQKIFNPIEINKTVNDLTLDANFLYNKCGDLYEVGDSKNDMLEKLLLYIKGNERKFKIFSKVAGEILDESGYGKK